MDITPLSLFSFIHWVRLSTHCRLSRCTPYMQHAVSSTTGVTGVYFSCAISGTKQGRRGGQPDSQTAVLEGWRGRRSAVIRVGTTRGNASVLFSRS